MVKEATVNVRMGKLKVEKFYSYSFFFFFLLLFFFDESKPPSTC